MERLQELLDEGIIDEVYNQLKTGKEAEVWLVSHRGEPVAAKLYKAREFRSFKNDAGYKEGRQVRNTRTQRAMARGSKFGREAAEEAWKSAEADALFALHKAGVRVPKPVLFYEGVLLMEVIGDAEGRVAPRLVDAALTREQAGPLYEILRGEIIKMLAADWIHGDLSEFNVLLSASGPVIIDLPQVVTAAKNSLSEKYFRRDLGNMLRFFSTIDPALEAKHAGDGDEIWRAYVRRHLGPHFVPSGRAAGNERRGGGPPHGHGQRGRGGPPQGQRDQGNRRDGPRPPQEQNLRGGAPQRGGGPQQNNRPNTRSGAQQDLRGGPPRGGGGQQPNRGSQQGGGGPGNTRGGSQQQQNPRGGQGRPQQGGPQQSRGPSGGGRPQRFDRNQRPRGPEVSFRGQAPGQGQLAGSPAAQLVTTPDADPSKPKP